MRRSLKLTAIAGAASAIAALALPAVAGADGFGPGGAHGHDGGFGHRSTVYVQTNDPTGNQVVTYLSDGRGLHEVGRTDTGGLGVAHPGCGGGQAGVAGRTRLRPDGRPARRRQRWQQHALGVPRRSVRSSVGPV